MIPGTDSRAVVLRFVFGMRQPSAEALAELLLPDAKVSR